MSGEILNLAREASPDFLEVEICIIGSGPGGATAAWELARAGHEVVVLEEGGDYTGAALTRRDGEMYDALYADRGGRSTEDLAISVLQGRVLGGGPVVNACDVVPIRDPLLRYWEVSHGLKDFTPAVLEPYRQLALQDLSASVPGEELLNENNQALRRGAAALGWKGEQMMHNRASCAGIGTCLIGCPLDAKRNPRFVAIPNAVASGARFLIRARVERIDQPMREVKTVRAVRLDDRGYHEGEPFTVRAKVVILAASAVGTAALLLRSGIGNSHVGEHLSLQPQLPITARFDEEIRFFRGIPQSYAVTEFERQGDEKSGLGGFRLEAIGGTPGIVASLLPQLGAAGKTWMSQYHRMAAALLLVPDGPNGQVRVERSGRLRIGYRIPDEQKQRYRDAVKAAARLYLAAGAREVLLPVNPPVRIAREADLAQVDALAFEPATAPFMSAHQQGTVRFSPNERDGAANPDGRVYGTNGVYAFDSSGFPSSASSHTMAPILTVSRYLSRRLIAALA